MYFIEIFDDTIKFIDFSLFNYIRYKSILYFTGYLTSIWIFCKITNAFNWYLICKLLYSFILRVSPNAVESMTTIKYSTLNNNDLIILTVKLRLQVNEIRILIFSCINLKTSFSLERLIMFRVPYCSFCTCILP